MAQDKKKRVIEYSDEINEELSGIQRNAVRIGADFPYIHKSRLWNFAAAVVYRGIMTPFAYLYCKCKFGLRIVGAKKLRDRNTDARGCFVYGNHTLMAGDAFIPNMVSFPRRTYVVVNADNLSVRGTRNWIQMSGALPIPNELSGMRAFLSAMETRLGEGHCIMIYPEAHIWPYYTGIRPFGTASFRYPAKLEAPVYSTTVTYSRRRIGKTPRVTVYVDGPFEATAGESVRERERQLRDSVYQAMCSRAQNSSYARIEYRKKRRSRYEYITYVCRKPQCL